MKQFLTTIVCILGLCGMQTAQAAAQERAESSISLEYKMVENEDLYRLMDFLDVYRLDVKVIGEGLEGREFRVITAICQDSVFTEKGADGYSLSAHSDTLDFTFFAKQTSPDTVKISWTGGGAMFEDELPAPESSHPILMETYSTSPLTTGDTVPIMAYSPGQTVEVEMFGQKGSYIDYCGLRDAKVHPSEWPAKYGIKDFVYFYIQFL